MRCLAPALALVLSSCAVHGLRQGVAPVVEEAGVGRRNKQGTSVSPTSEEAGFALRSKHSKSMSPAVSAAAGIAAAAPGALLDASQDSAVLPRPTLPPLTPMPAQEEQLPSEANSSVWWPRWLQVWLSDSSLAAARGPPTSRSAFVWRPPRQPAPAPERTSAVILARAVLKRVAAHVGDDLASSVADCLPCFMVAWMDDSGAVFMWEPWRGEGPQLLGNHTGRSAGAAFLGDGHCLVTLRDDGLAMVWNTSSGRLLQSLRVHSQWRTEGLEVFADGEHVIIYATGSEVDVWNALSGERSHRLDDGHEHRHEVKRVQASRDGRRILVHSRGYRDRIEYINLWSADAGERLHPEWHLPYTGTEVRLLEDDKLVVCERNRLQDTDPPRARSWSVVRASTGQSLGEPADDPEAGIAGDDGRRVRARDEVCVGISDDGRRVAVYDYQTQKLSVWDTASNRQPLEPVGVVSVANTSAPSSVDFLPGGGRLVLSRYSEDYTSQIGMRYLWDVKADAQPQGLGPLSLWCTGSSMVTDGHIVVTQSSAVLSLWDASTGRRLLGLELPPPYGFAWASSAWAERSIFVALRSLRHPR